MTGRVPAVGEIVQYTLTEQDAAAVNRRREDARKACSAGNVTGFVVHVGNSVSAGDVFPLVITRAWGGSADSAVNGQVLLDGSDTLWVTSVTAGEGPRRFTWPQRD